MRSLFYPFLKQSIPGDKWYNYFIKLLNSPSDHTEQVDNNILENKDKILKKCSETENGTTEHEGPGGKCDGRTRTA